MSNRIRFYAMLFFALFRAALPLCAAIDSTLFTDYTLNPGAKTIDLVVCGSLPGSSGCYGAGSIGPFGKIGAMLEGLPRINVAKGTVTRFLYVLDVAAGPNGDHVELHLFKKVDTISGGDDTVTVAGYKTITLRSPEGDPRLRPWRSTGNSAMLGPTKTNSPYRSRRATLPLHSLAAFLVP